MHRPGTELAIARSRVRRPNHALHHPAHSLPGQVCFVLVASETDSIIFTSFSARNLKLL